MPVRAFFVYPSLFIFIEIFFQLMTEPRTFNAEYISRINKAFDYIDSNIEKPMTLEELAAVANFAKFHFNRIFQSIVGKPPFKFILRVRLEKAASLILANKNESISNIAFKCGFSEVSGTNCSHGLLPAV